MPTDVNYFEPNDTRKWQYHMSVFVNLHVDLWFEFSYHLSWVLRYVAYIDNKMYEFPICKRV